MRILDHHRMVGDFYFIQKEQKSLVIIELIRIFAPVYDLTMFSIQFKYRI